jgi:hypothetical protein
MSGQEEVDMIEEEGRLYTKMIFWGEREERTIFVIQERVRSALI